MIYVDKKMCSRMKFIQDLLEKFNISWKLETKDTSSKNFYVFDLSAKILDKYAICHFANFRMRIDDIADLSDEELDASYFITLRVLYCFIDHWKKSEIQRFKYHICSKDLKYIDNVREKLSLYLNLKNIHDLIGYNGFDHAYELDILRAYNTIFNDDTFNNLVQNLILDGFDLVDFPDIDEVL